ncbi:YbdK family carboxylate-amine ligase [Serratia sp. AKBS12]|uniref:YbdK family carboxylate-amine ligase n=1 Tax=Serratia sp. AKBS12 TaxID=2974597 RepID=UPI002166ADFA|nr:YbdK family carboxylate-amine ligase [Serratia sp. AKBS12]MCS3408656.1 YbdK family carboxylate-amine ligase [Serratia sp. AKBS12]
MPFIPFNPSPDYTLGTELELQLIDLTSCDLSQKGLEIIKAVNNEKNIKEELTLSTIEINSTVHKNPFTLYDELSTIASQLSDVAASHHCGLCGGGRHLTSDWKEQCITPTERYQEVYEHLGFLAKLSCVFGQHIHVGVESGDDAIYLCHALIPYLPHFIALSASSPYYQSVDTRFASSRFSALNSFHTFGYIENIHNWQQFNQYVDTATRLGIIQCLKDIYWEIRPKPDFGTVEIRVCDTPLSIYHACMLSGYAQLLVKYLLDERRPLPQSYHSAVTCNTFCAQRYGFNAPYIDCQTAEKTELSRHLLFTLQRLYHYASGRDIEVLDYLKQYVMHGENDADRIRGMAQAGYSESCIIQTMMALLTSGADNRNVAIGA